MAVKILFIFLLKSCTCLLNTLIKQQIYCHSYFILRHKFNSPYTHENEKHNCVLTSTYKNLCRSNRRKELVAFSKTAQQRPQCCNSLIKQMCGGCIHTCAQLCTSAHVYWKEVGKGTEAHLQQYKLNTIHLLRTPLNRNQEIL